MSDERKPDEIPVDDAARADAPESAPHDEQGSEPEATQPDAQASLTDDADAATTDVHASVADTDDAEAGERVGEETPAGSSEQPVAAPVGMPTAELKAVVEALVFASAEPLTPKMLYRLLPNEKKEDVSAAINALKADYLERPGLQWVEVAGGYQITTRPELHEWVRRLFHERSTQKLSVQALETLAVISYRQPVTALEIADIRGVNTSGVLSTLLERHLVKIVGRKNIVGRPFLYATTKDFLVRFGLKDLADLPKIEDLADALGFDPPARLVEQTPRDEMLPLEEEEDGEKSPIEDAPA